MGPDQCLFNNNTIITLLLSYYLITQVIMEMKVNSDWSVIILLHKVIITDQSANFQNGFLVI